MKDIFINGTKNRSSEVSIMSIRRLLCEVALLVDSVGVVDSVGGMQTKGIVPDHLWLIWFPVSR
jgi:hypothetical protein